MTCLPPLRVKSPLWEAMIFSFGSALMASSNPSFRSLAGADPVVPWISTMFTVSVADLDSSTSQVPAFFPSSTKSEPRKVLYSVLSDESTALSVRMTGIWAFLASFSTVSQPDSTTGEKAMTSTFCWM